MGGPNGQTTFKTILPAGEAHKQYDPTGLAWEILNMVQDDDGTIRSVRGPTIWEPGDPQAAPNYGVFHGVFHTGAPRDFLLIRTGTQLRRHAGWDRNYEVLVSNLSDDANPRFPDQFCVINGQIIWTNGIDRARVVLPDNTVARLGFSRTPSAPNVESPTHIDADNVSRTDFYSNSGGYSFPGRIGTVGDEISQVEAKLLRGAWYYYLQYEDIFGNLSPMSPVSNAASVFPQSVLAVDGAGDPKYEEIDDLTRQFLVRTTGDAPAHAVAMRLYRTPDTLNNDVQPRLVARIPGTAEQLYPDNVPDSELGANATDVLAVPTFKLCTVHQGRLVIANTGNDPGAVVISDIGLPGTFRKEMRVIPDSNGAEVTGVVSYMDNLLVFTETCIYLLTVADGSITARPLREGVGCVAPSSIRAMRSGLLLWLGREGFYSMGAGGEVTLASEPISDLRDRVNMTRASLCVAEVEPHSDLYMCAVAVTGSPRQTLVVTYDDRGWRHMGWDIDIRAMATLRDERGYVLMGGNDGDANNLFVFDHETTAYTPATYTHRYRSGWFRADEHGMTQFRVRMIYLKFIRAWGNTAIVRFYKNGKWEQVGENQFMRLVDTAFNENDLVAGDAIIGTTKVKAAPDFWRKCPTPPGLDTCHSFAFSIEVNYPAFLHLASLGFDIAQVGKGQVYARIEEPV